LLVSEAGAEFFTDSRYSEAANKKIRSMPVYEISQSAFKHVAERLKRMKIRRLGFEESDLSYQSFCMLASAVGENKLRPTSGVVERLRLIKDEAEVACIRRAARISASGLKYIHHLLLEGAQEREIAIELELFFSLNGAEKAAFPTIVAFGRHSSMPHHRNSRYRLKPGNPILIDFGARFEGYNSDLTRTATLHTIPHRFKEIYQIVLEAQLKAIEKIRPGAKLCRIDEAARGCIAGFGYGKNFRHGLGHGLGLEVHEGPILKQGSPDYCRKGMVFTVEPGIYLPGWGGVRIEDDVLVTVKGCEVLTRSCSKALRAI